MQTPEERVIFLKAVESFVRKFNSGLRFDEKLVVKTQNRYFLVSDDVRRFVRKSFYYAGTYLGKVKGDVFFPSFLLLSMMAREKAKKVVVDDKAAWLFICGRDIFKRGVLKVEGSKKKRDYTLVLNQRNECLGFGRISVDLDEAKGGREVVVRNVSDLGDFLRREKKVMRSK